MKLTTTKLALVSMFLFFVASCGSGVTKSSMENDQPGLNENVAVEKTGDKGLGDDANTDQAAAGGTMPTGIMKIAELVENAKQYEGKTVKISGEITKINSKIMGRNWLHLKDGSKDDFDLVVTTKEVLNLGEKVTLNCTVSLNKDFGAGYKYDLILENGEIVK